jgi:hypothetical protein
MKFENFNKILVIYPILLILLGLPNPANFTDGVISLVLFSYVFRSLVADLKLKRWWLSVLVLLLVFGLYVKRSLLPVPYIFAGLLVGIILFYFVNLLANQFKKRYFYVLPIILMFLISSFFNSSKLRNYLAADPAPKTYTHDMGLYLKTYYLMNNNDYYKAHLMAFQNHAYFGVAGDVWGWRMPTTFYLWRVIPGNNGVNIYYLFIILASLALITTYSMGLKVLSKKGSDGTYLILIPVYLLYSYLHFPAYDWTLLQIEWWAALFAIFALWSFLNKYRSLSISFFSLAVIMREQLLIPIFLIALLGLVVDRKYWWKYFIPVGVFIAFLMLHSGQVASVLGSSLNSGSFSLRLNGGLKLLHSTFAFGTWEYYFYQLRPFLVLFLLNIVSLLYRRKWSDFVFLAFFSLPLAYLVIGTSWENVVWGVLYVPVVLISTLFSLDVVFKKMRVINLLEK